jgi:hypothetical protein
MDDAIVRCQGKTVDFQKSEEFKIFYSGNAMIKVLESRE